MDFVGACQINLKRIFLSFTAGVLLLLKKLAVKDTYGFRGLKKIIGNDRKRDFKKSKKLFYELYLVAFFF
jgi:hypothetical protein